MKSRRHILKSLTILRFICIFCRKHQNALKPFPHTALQFFPLLFRSKSIVYIPRWNKVYKTRTFLAGLIRKCACQIKVHVYIKNNGVLFLNLQVDFPNAPVIFLITLLFPFNQFSLSSGLRRWNLFSQLLWPYCYGK